jgi:hypothetical protein
MALRCIVRLTEERKRSTVVKQLKCVPTHHRQVLREAIDLDDLMAA